MSVPPVIFDVVVAFLILLMTYAISSEGLWGAALMFFNVLFGGLIAFNFYEPLAKLIDSTGIPWGFSDTLSLLGLFCVSVMLLRMATETLAPAMVRFPMPDLSRGPALLRPGHHPGHDVDPDPGFPHGPGAQESLRSHGLQVQTPLWTGA